MSVATHLPHCAGARHADSSVSSSGSAAPPASSSVPRLPGSGAAASATQSRPSSWVASPASVREREGVGPLSGLPSR